MVESVFGADRQFQHLKVRWVNNMTEVGDAFGEKFSSVQATRHTCVAQKRRNSSSTLDVFARLLRKEYSVIQVDQGEPPFFLRQ